MKWKIMDIHESWTPMASIYFLNALCDLVHYDQKRVEDWSGQTITEWEWSAEREGESGSQPASKSASQPTSRIGDLGTGAELQTPSQFHRTFIFFAWLAGPFRRLKTDSRTRILWVQNRFTDFCENMVLFANARCEQGQVFHKQTFFQSSTLYRAVQKHQLGCEKLAVPGWGWSKQLHFRLFQNYSNVEYIKG